MENRLGKGKEGRRVFQEERTAHKQIRPEVPGTGRNRWQRAWREGAMHEMRVWVWTGPGFCLRQAGGGTV